jgi:hypothetical protein
MRLCARSLSGSLLVAAFVAGVGAAAAQELQLDSKSLDTKALDASGASSVQTKRGKGKRGGDAAAAQPTGKPAGGPNRQFGELEGWSPGKAPPKGKDDPTPTTSSSNRAPVNVTPTGNMSVGLPF